MVDRLTALTALSIVAWPVMTRMSSGGWIFSTFEIRSVPVKSGR